MKKIGIITLTRQDSLACSTLKKIVSELDYQAICGEAIGAESIYLSLEDLTLRGQISGRLFCKSRIFRIRHHSYFRSLFGQLVCLAQSDWMPEKCVPAPIILG